MMLGRPQKGWCKNGTCPLPASLATVMHFLPLQPVLMHSSPSYAPCHSHHCVLLSITLQDRQLPACLLASSTQLHNRVDSTGGWWAGSLLSRLGRLLKPEDIAGVTVADVCLPWSCCLFFFCNPPRWSGRAQLPGTKQNESLISFSTLLPLSRRLLSGQISHLGLLLCSLSMSYLEL